MRKKSAINVDALVPGFNEEGRVGRVLKVLTNSRQLKKIIFVDDGSTDDSLNEVKKIPGVEIIRLKKNRGKGAAVKAGVKRVTAPAVFLCDADLTGLREKHVAQMVKGYRKNPEGMVVGLVEMSQLPGVHWLRVNILPLISGQRIVSTENLKEVVRHQISSEYGLEPYMNHYFNKKGQPIKRVLLKGVGAVPKWKKKSSGLRPYLGGGVNLLQKYLGIYTKEIPREVYNGLKSFIFPTYGIDPSKYRSAKIRVEEIELNYVKTGKGPILVFVHGWANNWEGWGPVIPYLMESFTIYLLDLPGFGDSGDLAEYSIEIAARYLAGLVRKLPEKPLAVVGLSMGSMVVAEFGRRSPKLTESVVLIGPVIKDGNLNVVSLTLKYSLWFIRHFDLSELALKKIVETRLAAYVVSRYVNMYRFNRFLVDTYGIIGKKKMRQKAFVEMGISIVGYDLKAVLDEYELPALLLYGREDKISSSTYAKREILPKNPHLKCVDVPEAGHVASLEQPERAAKAITEFVTSL